MFSSDVTFENSAGEISFSPSKVLSGSLEDDGLANVDGVLTEDGQFDGHIQTRDGLFYIEPSNRYKQVHSSTELGKLNRRLNSFYLYLL